MSELLKNINLKKPIVNRKLIAWVFVLTGLVSVGFWWTGRSKTTTSTSPNSTKIHEGEVMGWWDIWNWWRPLKITYTVEKKKLEQRPAVEPLISKLQQKLVDQDGNYGIYVWRLLEDTGYGISETDIFPAASIMKVPIMVATYRKIEEGQVKLEGVESQLEAMGKKSDNAAAAALIKLIGRPFMRQTLVDLGMTNSNFDDNTTTAKDVAVMWRKLYEAKLINSDHKQQLWQFLTDSIYEERIPAGVGSNTQVIHKVGSDANIWADAGIVMAPKPFVLVVINKEVTLTQAQDFVPLLVKDIWNFEVSDKLPQ